MRLIPAPTVLGLPIKAVWRLRLTVMVPSPALHPPPPPRVISPAGNAEHSVRTTCKNERQEEEGAQGDLRWPWAGLTDSAEGVLEFQGEGGEGHVL